MSTRANIIIKDARTTLYFYRHSDGYPECFGNRMTGLSEAEIDRLFQLIIEMKAFDRILGQSTEKEE